jgi:hypothetical protein
MVLRTPAGEGVEPAGCGDPEVELWDAIAVMCFSYVGMRIYISRQPPERAGAAGQPGASGSLPFHVA